MKNLKHTFATLRDAGCNTATDFLIFAEVAESSEPTTVSAVSRSLGTPLSTASRVLWTLCQYGLIQQTPSPTDRRVKLLTLTKLGRDLVSKAMR